MRGSTFQDCCRQFQTCVIHAKQQGGSKKKEVKKSEMHANAKKVTMTKKAIVDSLPIHQGKKSEDHLDLGKAFGKHAHMLTQDLCKQLQPMCPITLWGCAAQGWEECMREGCSKKARSNLIEWLEFLGEDWTDNWPGFIVRNQRGINLKLYGGSLEGWRAGTIMVWGSGDNPVCIFLAMHNSTAV